MKNVRAYFQLDCCWHNVLKQVKKENTTLNSCWNRRIIFICRNIKFIFSQLQYDIQFMQKEEEEKRPDDDDDDDSDWDLWLTHPTGQKRFSMSFIGAKLFPHLLHWKVNAMTITWQCLVWNTNKGIWTCVPASCPLQPQLS